MNVPTQSGGQKGNQPARPWKTEGLPKNSDGDQQPSNWWRLIRLVLVGYAAVFLALSLMDFQGTPQTIPYPEFTKQVSEGNVKKVFTRGDSIQGELNKAVDIPKDDNQPATSSQLSLWGSQSATTYTQFETERPSFAQDDLLALLKEKGVGSIHSDHPTAQPAYQYLVELWANPLTCWAVLLDVAPIHPNDGRHVWGQG